jgi:uncharacterized membrane protein
MIGNIVLDVGNFHHMMDWGYMNWWGLPFIGLFLIGVLIAIIVIVYIILKSEKSEEVEIISDAQKILDDRYAKGDITRKDYIQAKEDLHNFKQK